MTATYMYQQQMQQQQRQKQQDQQRNRPRSSPAASGLYPVVQDLSDVEYDNACCCGETFGSFRLADLVMPATVPSPSIWQQSSQKPPAKPSEQQRKHHQHQDEQQEQQSQEKVEVQASFEKDAHSEEQEPLQEDTTERREGSELHVSILPSSSGGLGGPTKSQSLHVQSSSGRDREEASSKLIRPHSVHRTKSGACLYEPESPTHSSSKRARRLSDAPSFYSNEDDEDDETQNKQSTPRQKDNWTKTGTPLSGKKLHLRRRSRQLMNRLLLTRNPSTATDNDDNKDLSTSETKDLTSMNDALWDVSFVFEGSYRTFKEHYVVIRQVRLTLLFGRHLFCSNFPNFTSACHPTAL